EAATGGYRDVKALAQELVDGRLHLVGSRRSLEARLDDAIRIDQEDPGLGGQPPLRDGRRQLLLGRVGLEVSIDLDVNEGQAASIVGLQALDNVHLGPADPA